jgi:hypothetical protein
MFNLHAGRRAFAESLQQTAILLASASTANDHTWAVELLFPGGGISRGFSVLVGCMSARA